MPPRDCGYVKVGSQKYNVKSDQLRCKRARRYTRRYLKDDRKPKGYSCTKYGSETNIEFRCTKGKSVLFAIRR